MRARHLLVGGLALLLGACSSGGGSHAPPPMNKQALAGKWKNLSDIQFIAGWDFADDGTVKVTVQGMEQPLSARYTWGGERSLDVEYQATPDVREAYKAAAKAYKDQLTERIKAGKLYERAGGPMAEAVRDELPARETLKVGIDEKRPLLILTNESAVSQTFEKAD